MSPNFDLTFLAAKEVDTRTASITNNITFTLFMMDLRVIGATNRPTSKIQTTPFAKPANVNIFIVQVGIRNVNEKL
jgi:hypothetical protein